MTKPALAALRKGGTLREQSLDALREAIITGALAPGSKLVEARLASELEVSRGPLREAIRQLAEEGLVEHIPYRGAYVRKLTIRDLEEMYSYRTTLETFAFKLAWDKRDARFEEELDRRHEALIEAILEERPAEGITTELNLHSLVYETADHKLLLDAWSALRGVVHFYFALHRQAHHRSGPYKDAHVTYVQRAKGTSLPAMLAEVEEHMQRGLDRVREFVKLQQARASE
ncbi:MAG: GntR family transcriptional regulator [Deinococcales bacterium]